MEARDNKDATERNTDENETVISSELIFDQDLTNQLALVFLFLISVALFVYGSSNYEWSIQWIEVIGISIPLPLFGIFPLSIFAILVHKLYNARLVLTRDYLMLVEGRFAWREKSIRIDYEHIREIEIDQSLLQRLLGLGDLGITAIATTLEPTVSMPGLRNPRKVKDIIRSRMNDVGQKSVNHSSF